ncbi:MAG: acylneuraminate cytidylyltransferase [Chloroflexi bacterium]|nr:MAG: acylneuraminate cytidylyltransferase [Chloroflexota bacterium]MBL1192849.1 acylneuraminate cytidylyltransferase [Chloroflexota bacterium]NOH10142.1 glycosyltransferase family protein [Chloroflexota bacterium]
MSDPRLVTIVQARYAASRLPGKVLADLGGRTVLGWTVERARRAHLPGQVVVATTTDASDDAIAEFCERADYPYFRGSMHDVLDRYYRASQYFGTELIVRLTADCPIIDPALIDQTITAFAKAEPPPDFAANRLPGNRTTPIGMDTEICTFEALETAWKETNEGHHREHVMPFFYENPERFNILHVLHEPDYGHHRWTVDTPEDLELLRRIVAHFAPRDDFTLEEVIELFEEQPELYDINAEVQHKTQYDVDKRR